MLSLTPHKKPSAFSPNTNHQSPPGLKLPAVKFATKSNVTTFTDDIDANEWLTEIGLAQYANTFITNLSVGGELLSRKRLSQIRIKDFPNMNITNYDHQKILKEHIDHTLQFAFYSPVRRREVKKKFSSLNLSLNPNEGLAATLSRDLTNLNVDSNYLKRADHKSIGPRRRRSFENQIWSSISQSRNTDNNSTASDLLRAGKLDVSESKEESTKDVNRRRRWTFGDESTDQIVLKSNKGTLYGNMALEYDMLQKEMAILQMEHLNYFKNLIKCERASMLFTNESKRDMMLCTDGVWYRIPLTSGLAGYCAESGECLNVPDAYSDHRFNRNIDIKTGFKTRSVLCQPVRSYRGGGHIVGVIQMLNKIEDGAFDASDEDLLAKCVQRVSDDLNSRFKELLKAAEKFVGNAIFIGEKGGKLNSHRFDAETVASVASRAPKRDNPAEYKG